MTLSQPRPHDLSLPAWGPYNKKYNGLAHIPDLSRGIRFDLSVFPGYYRHGLSIPNCKWESGYHPWEAAPGLSYFSYRYELEWKDQVYCDVAYFAAPGEADGASRLVRCEFVNNTDLDQQQSLHYMAYLNFPPVRPYSEEPVLPALAHLPEGAQWIDALDYDDLQYAAPRPSDTLVYEGWMRGEMRAHDFVHGTGIGCGFGLDSGDRVTYTFPSSRLDQAVLFARYRAPTGAVTFDLSGHINGEVVFAACDDLQLIPIPLGLLAAGEHTLALTSRGGGALELDGFVLLDEGAEDEVHFTQHIWDPVPSLEPGPGENTLLLRYPDLPTVYGLAWGGPGSVVRQIFSSELDRTLRYYVNEHVQTLLHGDDQGHFTNVYIRPILLAPHSSTVLYGLVCHGSADEVRRQLGNWNPDPVQLENGYALARSYKAGFPSNPSGEDYRFSQERMAATLLTNVVYPVYTRRSFIRHFTPGKWWDCLYTWDSGFISLGLLEVDPARAIDCLNAYTTPPGDTQAVFIHHGSPVPVQITAFLELWNRTRSPELLEYFYPRLRQYYRFLAGRLGSSTTRRMKSNLLQTWDYFYNTGGWDDLPPQLHVHAHGLEARVTPVVTTAHALRSAKILQMAARELGRDQNVEEYQADIDTWVESLNRYSWDAEAGVFSYVIHDENGQPVDILRHESGQNFNLGLDGISPFFAGVCGAEQEQRILERVASPEHLWTPVGMVSVDQSAAYYRPEGYWNGSVWFPYQWYIWKALLDRGHGDLAFRIAHTALEAWKNEVGASYNCFEQFVVASGRGGGWHHFGGLSAPVLAWFSAYHRPGTLTCGFETWVQRLDTSPDLRSLQADLLRGDPTGERLWLALVVLPAGPSYRVEWNGSPAEVVERLPGTLEVRLRGSGRLVVRG